LTEGFFAERGRSGGTIPADVRFCGLFSRFTFPRRSQGAFRNREGMDAICNGQDDRLGRGGTGPSDAYREREAAHREGVPSGITWKTAGFSKMSIFVQSGVNKGFQ
jgi:hypothetical protein